MPATKHRTRKAHDTHNTHHALADHVMCTSLVSRRWRAERPNHRLTATSESQPITRMQHQKAGCQNAHITHYGPTTPPRTAQQKGRVPPSDLSHTVHGYQPQQHSRPHSPATPRRPRGRGSRETGMPYHEQRHELPDP